MATVGEPRRRDPAEHFPDAEGDPAFAEWALWLRGGGRSAARAAEATVSAVRRGYIAYAEASMAGIAEFLQEQGQPPPTDRERQMLAGFYQGFLAGLNEMLRLASLEARRRR